MEKEDDRKLNKIIKNRDTISINESQKKKK